MQPASLDKYVLLRVFHGGLKQTNTHQTHSVPEKKSCIRYDLGINSVKLDETSSASNNELLSSCNAFSWHYSQHTQKHNPACFKKSKWVNALHDVYCALKTKACLSCTMVFSSICLHPSEILPVEHHWFMLNDWHTLHLAYTLYSLYLNIFCSHCRRLTRSAES